MTVPNNANTVSYACDGGTTEFDFTFPVPSSEATSAVKAKTVDSDDVETELTYGTDYSVSAPNEDYSSGGTVTTVDTYASGITLVIYRELPLQQQVTFVEGGATPAETHQAVADRLAMMIQDVSQRLDEETYPSITASIIRADLGVFMPSEFVIYEGALVCYEDEPVTYKVLQ